MFRLSQYIREFNQPTPVMPRRNPPGPVVIWNLIRRCNLTCKHCYSISADKDFPGELNTEEIFSVLQDLKKFKVPALVLSGGEPLLRPDIFEISQRAKDMGFFVALSSNGTLIDDNNIEEIDKIGFGYVGISLDGMRETHDKFRRKAGAFDASLRAVRLCRDRGLKVGLRFTMTQDNEHELPAMLNLLDEENVERFYFSHLNYAGRGNHNRKDDARFAATRRSMELLFEYCLKHELVNTPKEIVTGNNDADGPFFLRWVERKFPTHASHINAKLRERGGNASGLNVANIDNLGNVHADTMWWHYSFGNVRDRPFSEIWTDTHDPLMAGLKQYPRPVTGRCAECRYLVHCGGNSRVRAHQVTDNFWAEDPGCYLTDEEIGVTPRDRVTTTPFSARRRTSVPA